MSRHPVTPADRRFLRWLPMTLLVQRPRGQPERILTEFPQLRRLLRARLISTSYDASLNAITINRGAGLAAEEFLLAPPAGPAR